MQDYIQNYDYIHVGIKLSDKNYTGKEGKIIFRGSAKVEEKESVRNKRRFSSFSLSLHSLSLFHFCATPNKNSFPPYRYSFYQIILIPTCI